MTRIHLFSNENRIKIPHDSKCVNKRLIIEIIPIF